MATQVARHVATQVRRSAVSAGVPVPAAKITAPGASAGMIKDAG